MWRAGLGSLLLAGASSGQVTQRVSVTSTGAELHYPGVFEVPACMSADGRLVVFASYGTDLVPGDTNGCCDVFVRDRSSGTTERVSVDSAGVQGNNTSYLWCSSMSADGRYVAFESLASNLVPGDTNGHMDIFVRDRQLRTTERVSVDSNGLQGNSNSMFATISSDGRYVAFMSLATNLVPMDNNGVMDIFVHDRRTGRTERESVDSMGVEGNGDSASAVISADGRFVVIHSYASNLVPGDTNGKADVFLRDRLALTTERVSVGQNGVEGNGESQDGFGCSADGRYVVFDSYATNLIPGDTNGCADVFLRDRANGTTERVSLGQSGIQGNNDSRDGMITPDGRYVAFHSLATNLIPADTNGCWDVFVRDRQLGTLERVSISSEGTQGNDVTWLSSISADGRWIAFQSFATNLVPRDRNGALDVFVRDRIGGTDFTSLCSPSVGGVIACPCSNPPGGSDRGCDNSSGTGGAILSASGGTYLSSDSLLFTTNGEKTTALSIVAQWTGVNATGAIFGMGVRCTSGTLERLYTKDAAGGSITAPEFGSGDPSVSSASAARGDVIQPGQSRWYLVYYRDPIVLGGCPATSTFNATQTGRVAWWP